MLGSLQQLTRSNASVKAVEMYHSTSAQQPIDGRTSEVAILKEAFGGGIVIVLFRTVI
jgi:hypothetical protein